MLQFCNKNKDKDIYVFGYSKNGRLVYNYLRMNGIDVKGFVISDSFPVPNIAEYSIYRLKDINMDTSALILAIRGKSYNEVIPSIVKKGISDLYFISGMRDHEALQSMEGEYEEESYLDNEYACKMSEKIFRYLNNAGIELNSAIDVGCGIGSWLRGLKAINEQACVLGIDGSSFDRSKVLEKDEFMRLDLRSLCMDKIVKERGRFDVCISIEVAEHLDKKYADSFIRNLCIASDIVLFSAAVKYQGGEHHVNEQPQSYWAEKFEKNGYTPIDSLRGVFWEDKDINVVVKQNIILYVRDNIYDRIKKGFTNNKYPFDLVHPEYYNFIVASYRCGELFV